MPACRSDIVLTFLGPPRCPTRLGREMMSSTEPQIRTKISEVLGFPNRHLTALEHFLQRTGAQEGKLERSHEDLIGAIIQWKNEAVQSASQVSKVPMSGYTGDSRRADQVSNSVTYLPWRLHGGVERSVDSVTPQRGPGRPPHLQQFLAEGENRDLHMTFQYTFDDDSGRAPSTTRTETTKTGTSAATHSTLSMLDDSFSTASGRINPCGGVVVSPVRSEGQSLGGQSLGSLVPDSKQTSVFPLSPLDSQVSAYCDGMAELKSSCATYQANDAVGQRNSPTNIAESALSSRSLQVQLSSCDNDQKIPSHLPSSPATHPYPLAFDPWHLGDILPSLTPRGSPGSSDLTKASVYSRPSAWKDPEHNSVDGNSSAAVFLAGAQTFNNSFGMGTEVVPEMVTLSGSHAPSLTSLHVDYRLSGVSPISHTSLAATGITSNSCNIVEPLSAQSFSRAAGFLTGARTPMDVSSNVWKPAQFSTVPEASENALERGNLRQVGDSFEQVSRCAMIAKAASKPFNYFPSSPSQQRCDATDTELCNDVPTRIFGGTTTNTTATDLKHSASASFFAAESDESCGTPHILRATAPSRSGGVHQTTADQDDRQTSKIHHEYSLSGFLNQHSVDRQEAAEAEHCNMNRPSATFGTSGDVIGMAPFEEPEKLKTNWAAVACGLRPFQDPASKHTCETERKEGIHESLRRPQQPAPGQRSSWLSPKRQFDSASKSSVQRNDRSPRVGKLHTRSFCRAFYGTTTTPRWPNWPCSIAALPLNTLTHLGTSSGGRLQLNCDACLLHHPYQLSPRSRCVRKSSERSRRGPLEGLPEWGRLHSSTCPLKCLGARNSVERRYSGCCNAIDLPRFQSFEEIEIFALDFRTRFFPNHIGEPAQAQETEDEAAQSSLVNPRKHGDALERLKVQLLPSNTTNDMGGLLVAHRFLEALNRELIRLAWSEFLLSPGGVGCPVPHLSDPSGNPSGEQIETKSSYETPTERSNCLEDVPIPQQNALEDAPGVSGSDALNSNPCKENNGVGDDVLQAVLNTQVQDTSIKIPAVHPDVAGLGSRLAEALKKVKELRTLLHMAWKEWLMKKVDAEVRAPQDCMSFLGLLPFSDKIVNGEPGDPNLNLVLDSIVELELGIRSIIEGSENTPTRPGLSDIRSVESTLRRKIAAAGSLLLGMSNTQQPSV